MEIGIGLPTTIAGARPEQVIDWAHRAETRGFSSLGTIDRLVYGNYEPLIALAAAAAVTSRIRLLTAIAILPYRATAVFGKQVASIDRLSHGRIILGVGLGGRGDDYEAAGMATNGRGRRLNDQLDDLRRIWAGEKRGFAGAIGPDPERKGGPVILMGGGSPASFERAARFADGWMAGGGGVPAFRSGSQKASEAWKAAGRPGVPRTAALNYFGLGGEGTAGIDAFLRDYYAMAGLRVEALAQAALTTPDKIREAIKGYEEAGCQELVLFPGSPNPDQVDRLADLL